MFPQRNLTNRIAMLRAGAPRRLSVAIGLYENLGQQKTQTEAWVPWIFESIFNYTVENLSTIFSIKISLVIFSLVSIPIRVTVLSIFSVRSLNSILNMGS